MERGLGPYRELERKHVQNVDLNLRRESLLGGISETEYLSREELDKIRLIDRRYRTDESDGIPGERFHDKRFYNIEEDPGGENALKLREEISDEIDTIINETNGDLEYSMTEKAWIAIKKIKCLMQSLAGLDDNKSWNLRESLSKKFILLNKLPGIKDYREQHSNMPIKETIEKERIEIMMQSIKGIESQRAFKLRDKYKKKHPDLVAVSLCGVTNDKSMELRNELLYKCPLAVAISIKDAGISSAILDIMERLIKSRDNNVLKILGEIKK